MVCAALTGGVAGPRVLGQLIGDLPALTSFLLLAAPALVITFLGSPILMKHSLALRP